MMEVKGNEYNIVKYTEVFFVKATITLKSKYSRATDCKYREYTFLDLTK